MLTVEEDQIFERLVRILHLTEEQRKAVKEFATRVSDSAYRRGQESEYQN